MVVIRVEISLRNVNATNAIPYWDTTLEERLQNPADSILWTDMFMGESSEFDIITGPFAKWSTFPDVWLTLTRPMVLECDQFSSKYQR